MYLVSRHWMDGWMDVSWQTAMLKERPKHWLNTHDCSLVIKKFNTIPLLKFSALQLFEVYSHCRLHQ